MRWDDLLPPQVRGENLKEWFWCGSAAKAPLPVRGENLDVWAKRAQHTVNGLANRLLSSVMQGNRDRVVWVARWTDRANRLLSSVMHDNRGLERKGWYRQLKGGVNGPITFEWCEIIDLVEIWRRMPKMGNWYETLFEKLIRVTVLRNWYELLFWETDTRHCFEALK